jgi:hypothetical protein
MLPLTVQRAIAQHEDKVRAMSKVPEQCFDNVNGIGVKILQSEVANAQNNFEQDQQDYDDLEQYETAIAGDVEHQHK